MTANVSVSNTTGLYIGSGASSVLNSAQQLLTILDNNGNVNFALDPTTSNTQVIAYFTGAFPGTYSNANVSAYLPTYTGSLANSSDIITLYANAATQAVSIQTTNANLGAFETYANATFGTSSYGNANVAAYLPTYAGSLENSSSIINLWANAATQSVSIQTTNANLGAFEIYANATFGTSSYGNTQAAAWIKIDPTITGIQANLGAFEIYSNTSTQTTNANLGAYQTWANASIQTTNANLGAFEIYSNTSTQTTSANLGAYQIYANANAATQATSIQTISANLGAFEIYANATFGTSNYGNANVAAYLPTYAGNMNSLNQITAAGAAIFNSTAAFNGQVSINNSAGVELIGTGGLSSAGNITTNTNANIVVGAGGYYYGDGSKLTNVATAYGNTQVAAFLPTYTGNLNGVLTSGNVYAPNVSITNTSGLAASSVTVQGGYGNASVIGGNYLNLIGGNGVTINQQGSPVQILGANLILYSNAYGGGLITTGNLITTSGVYWANGAAYSTAGIAPPPSFAGNLAGNVLYDGVNNRIQANAFPFSTPAATANSNYVNYLQNGPTYVAGVLQPPATATAGFATTLVTTANLGLQSSYQTSTNRTTIGSINYAQVTPVTANIMTLQDRVRGGASFTDIMLSGKTWGIMSTSSLFNTSVLGQINQLQLIGAGEVGPAYGMQGQVNVIPTSGSANVQYAAGVQSSVSYIAGTGATTSNIAYARLYTGQISGANGTTLNITNAIGLHTPSNWAGASSVNRYALLNEDTSTSITTLGNIYAQGNITTIGSAIAPNYLFANGVNILSTVSTYGNTQVGQYLPTYTGNISAGNIVVTTKISASSFTFANGQAYPGTYTNSNVTNLLSGGTYTGDINAPSGVVTASAVNSTGASTASAYLQAGAGVYSIGTFSGTYSDGIVVDYTTGNGRISVGTADALTFYSGGVGTTPTAVIYPTGNIIAVGSLTAASIVTAGNTTTTGNTILKGFTETVVAKGNSTGTVTIDANAGTVQTLTLTGSITINAANMTNFGVGRSVTLVLTQGGTGSYTLTSDMKFAGGSKTLSTAVGAIDVVNIFFDGTNYLAALVKGYA